MATSRDVSARAEAVTFCALVVFGYLRSFTSSLKSCSHVVDVYLLAGQGNNWLSHLVAEQLIIFIYPLTVHAKCKLVVHQQFSKVFNKL